LIRTIESRVSMSSSEVIRDLIEELHSSATPGDDLYSDEKTRIELLSAAQGLVAALTRPDEAVASITHGVRTKSCHSMVVTKSLTVYPGRPAHVPPGCE